MTLTAKWIDGMREPTQKPNPKYPHGIDLDISGGKGWTCKMKLPYPAKRCGQYLIECDNCGTNALITTAGRPDDPRSITLSCKVKQP